MIVHLSGMLLQKEPSHCVVYVGGVGYGLNVSLTTFGSLPEIGEGVRMPVHTYVREDQLVLFGFSSTQEREIFRKLISISGVGPKIALAILSGLTPRDLTTAIGKGDDARLSSIPGIGKKTAQRMIVELKGILPEDIDGKGPDGAGVGKSVRDDTASALINLGYSRSAAETAFDKASIDEGATIEEAVRATLKELCKA